MYITKQGQCWDQIAKEIYGSEKYTGILMEANRELLDIFVFPAGLQIETPELPAGKSSEPLWRRI